MSTISTSGINIGQIIKSEHLLRIIRALDGTVSNDIIISGSLTLNDSATFNNGITGSLFGTSSFATTAGGSNFSANSIVNLDNSTNVNRFIVFSETANGTPSPLYGEGAITYNPFTNTLTAQTFSGSLSGSAISSSFATTSSMTLAISGSNNRIPVFTGTRTLGNSRIAVKEDQVQINPTRTLEDSAILQIDSTDRGVLFPRMTSTERTAISNPAEGLIVWDTTLRQLCIRVSTSWYTFDLTAI